jgi:hypothetical protein
VRVVRAVSSGFAKDGGYADAMDAGRIERCAISSRFRVGGRTFAGDEPDFDLWTGADRTGAGAIGVETFSGGGGCTRFEGDLPQRDLFFGECAGGGIASGGDSAVRGRGLGRGGKTVKNFLLGLKPILGGEFTPGLKPRPPKEKILSQNSCCY